MKYKILIENSKKEQQENDLKLYFNIKSKTSDILPYENKNYLKMINYIYKYMNINK